jgi:hypothetical protein
MKYNEFIEYIKMINKEKEDLKKEIANLNKEFIKNKDKNIIVDINTKKIRMEKILEEIVNLNSTFLDIIDFNIDSDLKVGYLREKPIDTARADISALVAADEYELLLNKSVYNFSLSERNELIVTKFKNTTINSLMSTTSKIKGYIDYCIRQKDENGNSRVPHNQNIFDTFIKSEAKRFVSKQAIEFRYITREKLQEYINLLDNAQDRALLVCPYHGIRGRTIKGGTLEEIINLQIKPHSKDVLDGRLILDRNDDTSRELYVPSDVMEILLDAYNQIEYIPNNGNPAPSGSKGVKKYNINRYRDYVFCAIGNSKHGLLSPIVINSRFQKIQEYCDNQYITVYNLYMSGMITMAMDIYKRKGELESSDYIDICKQFKYGDTPEKYMSKVKYEVETYLKGGVKNA